MSRMEGDTGDYEREVAGSGEEWEGSNTKKEIFVKSPIEIWHGQASGNQHKNLPVQN